MPLIIPLGRETRLAKVPYATVTLMILTTFVFLNTWPSEKRFATARLPGAPLNSAANELTAVLLEPALQISPDVRSQVEKEKNDRLFPTVKMEELFQRADHEIENKSWELQELKARWKTNYERYNKLEQTLLEKGMPQDPPFNRYAFDPSRDYFPGLFTHIFLHAGFLHLLFNMFLLWIVGASIEERWGPLLFLGLYVSGGMAAGLAQEFIRSVSGIGIVGASGAVAAVMGAFLIRHFKMPIRFFYMFFTFYMFRSGTTTWPAWSLLLLWFGQQLLYAVLSDPRFGPGVAYEAHIGGFIYGALAGWFVLKGGVATTWEKEAATTKVGMELRDQEVASLMQNREFDSAIKLLDSQLTDNPRHLPALLAAVRANAIMENKSRLPSLVLRAVTGLLECGQSEQASFMIDDQMPTLAEGVLPDKEAMTLAQALTRLKRYPDALQWYGYLIQRYPSSPFRGKALFSAGKLHKELRQSAEAEKYFRTLLEKPYSIEWASMAQYELRTLSDSAA